jgi:hypothetical protein
VLLALLALLALLLLVLLGALPPSHGWQQGREGPGNKAEQQGGEERFAHPTPLRRQLLRAA